MRLLAETEGIFTEPAGGTTVAVTKKLIQQGRIPRDESIVISVTGNGYKTLEAVLDTLEADHSFLTEGGVFTEDLIETWIEYKRTKELDPIRLRPTPHEFEMYFDV